jgi:hypothetical protein
MMDIRAHPMVKVLLLGGQNLSIGALPEATIPIQSHKGVAAFLGGCLVVDKRSILARGILLRILGEAGWPVGRDNCLSLTCASPRS